jgi:hypothetical protein
VSYDLQIYAPLALPVEKIEALITAAGLTFEATPTATGSLTVLRGAKQNYSFTLGLPVGIEPEDVPEEVAAAALGAAHLYEVLVEGSSATETPHAIKFARRLAKAVSGVVLDQQTGQIWSRGKLRQAPRVETGVVSIVEVRWYARTAADGGRAAEAWLMLARRHLPEALPRRYGTYEPFQHRLDTDGDDAFIDFVRQADGDVFFAPTKPAAHGSLTAGPTFGGPIQSHGLTLLAEALNDERWRSALRRLFVGFAEHSEAVLATAEVRRGVRWSGRSLGYDGSTEHVIYLAPRGNWSGLPPYPVWWAWFGPDYAPLVQDHLAADQVEVHGPSLFHWRGDAPADRDQLLAALTPSGAKRRLFGRGPTAAAWLPVELLPVEDRSDPWIYNPPLTPAALRPAALC